MSWGANEFSSQTYHSYHFNPAGVTFVAATGDWGYGTLWPSANPKVVAAGGTTLELTPDGARASETAWEFGGSGCSKYEPKPARQSAIAGCAKRIISDVSAVADPNTGLAVYSSFNPYGTGWFQVGGTSLSSPLIAAMTAVASPTTQAGVFNRLYSAAGTPALFDVTAGANGSCAPITYLCTAGPGYDGPTGLGAPTGVSAL
jgi:subtilase family serine protease